MSVDPTEEQFTLLLGKYTGHRNRLLEKVALPKIVGHPLVPQVCCAVATLGVIISVFGQIGSVTLFSLHPFFMGLGCMFFMAEGVLVYRNRMLVNLFAPIMQHNKKRKARSFHQFLHVAALICMAFGYIAIVSNKVMQDKTVFPMTIHAWLGTCCMMYIIAQVAVGFRKLEALSTYPERRVARYHGEAGLLLFDLCMLTTLLGLLSFLEFSFKHVVVELLVVVMWLTIHTYMRMKAPQSDSARDAPSNIGSGSGKQGILIADETGDSKGGEMVI